MKHVSVRRPRLLLVEDSLLDIKLVEQALADMNSSVELSVFQNGEAASNFFLNTKPSLVDLVLLDLNLPLRNGLDVLADIRSMPIYSCLPVIVYTTSDAEDQVIKAYKNGANAFMQKPIDALAFMSDITSLIQFWFQTARLPAKDC